MSIRNDTIVARAEGPLDTSLPGETVILDPAQGAYFGLDEVGARVWELIAQPTSVSEVIDTLEMEYEVERPVLERDVVSLLDDLVGAGLARVVRS